MQGIPDIPFYPFLSIFTLTLQFTLSEAIEESEVYPGPLGDPEQDSHWLVTPRAPGPCDSPGRTPVTFRPHLQQHPLRGADHATRRSELIPVFAEFGNQFIQSWYSRILDEATCYLSWMTALSRFMYGQTDGRLASSTFPYHLWEANHLVQESFWHQSRIVRSIFMAFFFKELCCENKVTKFFKIQFVLIQLFCNTCLVVAVWAPMNKVS